MNNPQEFIQFLFDSIEFRLEIFSPGNSKYPPIFYDIRKEAGGPMYRSLRHLNVVNPSLVENFNSLKVSTQLLDNKIKLELALSQRANLHDDASFDEQPIGTYLIGDGETVDLSNLAQFGFAPMIAKAARVIAEEIPLEQVPQVNYTTGLRIVGVRKKAIAHLVTVKNISEQAIRKYAVGVDSSNTTSCGHANQMLPAQAEESHIFHLQPYSIFQPHEREKATAHEQRFVIGAAMYEENTCEGQGRWLLEMLLPPSDHIAELHALLQRLYSVPEDELEPEIAKVRMEAVTLLKRLGFPSDIRVREKHWAGDELIGNIALDWMHHRIKTFVRISERMPANFANAMNTTRQEEMETQLKHSQTLLQLLQQSE